MFALAEQPETRLQGIARRRRELDAMEAEWLALVDDYDRSGDWWDDGFRQRRGCDGAECRHDADRGADARAFGASARALAEGRFSALATGTFVVAKSGNGSRNGAVDG